MRTAYRSRHDIRGAIAGVWSKFRLDVDAAPTWQLFILIFVGIWVLYAATANYNDVFNNDTAGASMAAANLVTDGDLTLDEYPGTPWTVEAQGRTVSGRFPGVIFAGVPFYWLTGADPQDTPEPELIGPLGPGSLAAATLSALAVAVLFLVFTRLVPPSTALLGVLLAGLGTSTWSVSADELWTHGPQQLWLATAMAFMARERFLASGLGFGAALLTRPPSAVAAAVTGSYKAWSERRLSPMVLVGAGAAVGLTALLVYNHHVFGVWSPTGAYGRYESLGGYGDTFLENVLRMPPGAYLWNIGGALVSPHRGVLWTSAFLLPLLPGVPTAWREGPGWAKAAALGGVAELLLQLRADTYTGGEFFFSYRTPLGPLTMMAPLLLLAYRTWTAETSRRRTVFAVLAGLSILVHGVAAIFDLRY